MPFIGSPAVSLSIATAALMPAAYLSPWLWRKNEARRLRIELGRRRVVALTYDDGPSSGMTPRVLDLLASFNVKATFFMLGQRARAHPQLVDRVLAEGHDI